MRKCGGVTCCLIYSGATFHRSRDTAVCDRWTDIVPFPVPRVNPSLFCSLTDAEGGTGPLLFLLIDLAAWTLVDGEQGCGGWCFLQVRGKKIRVMQIWVMLSGLMLIVLQAKSYTQKLSKRQCLGMKAREDTYGGLIAKEAITLILATACHVYMDFLLFIILYLWVSDSDCKIIQHCQFWQSVELILN